MKALKRNTAIVFMLLLTASSTSLAQQPDCGDIAAAQVQNQGDSAAIAAARLLYDCASAEREQGNISAAISFLTTADGLAETKENRPLKLEILELLHLCYAETGNYRRAYATAEKAAAMHRRYTAMLRKRADILSLSLKQQHEATRNTERESRARLMELQSLQSTQDHTQLQLDVTDAWLEVERTNKDQARELLEKEAQIQAGIIERETLLRNVLIAAGILTIIFGFLVFRRMKDRKRASELKAEIAETRASALEVEKQQQEFESRKRFTRQLIDNQEQERKRIAADLHDGLGQDLLVIKNRLTLARREHDKGADPTGELDEILLAVNSSLQNIRSISRNLRPSQLDRVGLTSSIESMLEMLQDSCSFDLHYLIDDIDGLFSKEREIDVFRVVQESMNNIIKHAHAHNVNVNAIRDGTEVKITITDNGGGFSSQQSIEVDKSQATGFGIQGMKERVRILGGTMSIDSTPGKGTSVIAQLPFAETSQPENHHHQELEHAGTPATD